jgi:hypothetical protein
LLTVEPSNNRPDNNNKILQVVDEITTAVTGQLSRSSSDESLNCADSITSNEKLQKGDIARIIQRNCCCISEKFSSIPMLADRSRISTNIVGFRTKERTGQLNEFKADISVSTPRH